MYILNAAPIYVLGEKFLDDELVGFSEAQVGKVYEFICNTGRQQARESLIIFVIFPTILCHYI